ncbi:MAG: type II toxin-antitoxin system Phd/YefM family antitoxin [Candidatus Promineifilaceae bacterium]
MAEISVSEASRNLSHWINRASYGRELVLVTSRGKAKAVILGVDAFEALFGMKLLSEEELIPQEQFQKEFRKAMEDAGYETRDDIIELVREVRKEIVSERTAPLQEE